MFAWICYIHNHQKQSICSVLIMIFLRLANVRMSAGHKHCKFAFHDAFHNRPFRLKRITIWNLQTFQGPFTTCEIDFSFLGSKVIMKTYFLCSQVYIFRLYSKQKVTTSTGLGIFAISYCHKSYTWTNYSIRMLKRRNGLNEVKLPQKVIYNEWLLQTWQKPFTVSIFDLVARAYLSLGLRKRWLGSHFLAYCCLLRFHLS